MIFINIIQPLVTKAVAKILKKIPVNIQKITANTLLLIVIVDTAISSIRYLNIF